MGINGMPPESEEPVQAGTTKIWYKTEDGEIPFNEFIQTERVERGLEWDELEELCGGIKVRNYAAVNPGTRIVNPTREKLEVILAALGKDESSFRINGIRQRVKMLPDPNTPEFDKVLRSIGDAILEKNKRLEELKKLPQRFSVSYAEQIAGKHFMISYGSTHEDRSNLLARLKSLDPKYREIELQIQVQEQTKDPKSLTPLEWYFLRDGLARILASHKKHEVNGRLPNGSWRLLANHMEAKREEIAELLPTASEYQRVYERTIHSWKHHVEELRRDFGQYHKCIRGLQGSPVPNGELVKKKR